MKPFWRAEPFSAREQVLLDALNEAHYRAAFRGNVSRDVLLLSACGSGDYTKALVATLSTIGGVHGPLVQTFDFLAGHDPARLARAELEAGGKVPGWGNSFVRGEPDPEWSGVDAALRFVAPTVHDTIAAVTAVIHAHGRFIFPNPSAYTAATAIAFGMPRELTPFLFVSARLPAWTKYLHDNRTQWTGNS